MPRRGSARWPTCARASSPADHGRAEPDLPQLEQGQRPDDLVVTATPRPGGVVGDGGQPRHRLLGHGTQGEQVEVGGGVPAAVQTGLNDVSRACLVVAIAALGVKTSFNQLARAGWRPFALLLVETLWMAGFVLAAIYSAPMNLVSVAIYR